MMKDQVVSRLRCQNGKRRLKFYRTPTMQRASFTEEALSNLHFMMKDQVIESIAMPERKGPLEILPHANHAMRLHH
jgi:hypothetical protein